MRTFFTSDTHFGHANIIKYSGRPFKDVDHMNAAMVQAWNAVVAPGDVVYHLGDFAMGGKANVPKFLPQLNGTKILVAGNHDFKTSFMLESGFAAVLHQAVIKFPIDPRWQGMVPSLEAVCYLSHVPKEDAPHIYDDYWGNRRQVDYHLCGHVHDGFAEKLTDAQEPKVRVINVGVDQTADFAPHPLEYYLFERDPKGYTRVENKTPHRQKVNN
jgi:calcineurin-like phosphoesterase family protein